MNGEIAAVEKNSKKMRRFLFAAATILALSARAGAVAPSPMTSLQAIHELSNAEASKSIPVAFQATVTYFSADLGNLFVQEGQTGIYVWGAGSPRLSPGDRVLVKGVTARSFRPYIYASDVTLLGHGASPEAQPATFDDLISARFDSVLVTVRGVLRAANLSAPSGDHAAGSTLRILTDGGYVDAVVNDDGPAQLENLLDAQVVITGVAGGVFDGKRQQTGAALHVSSLTDIKVLEPAAKSPWSLVPTAMDEIMHSYHVKDLSSRIRVSGVVTYYEPGAALVLQNGVESLWISTHSFAPVRIGDEADAIGFPTVNDGFLNLAASEVRDSGTAAPINSQLVESHELTSSQHVFDLVSIEGRVAITARESSQDEYVLAVDGYEFSAIFRHPQNAGMPSLPPMKEIPVGSRIRVTGICVPDNTTPFRRNSHFNILLRSTDDIAVLGEPTWLTVPHLVQIAGLLLLLAVIVGARGWLRERKTRREIGSLAYVEQRRGRILESINSSEPLAEILERITELVSVRLNGAPCWCQIADGAALGNRPEQLDPSSLRTLEYPIAARSGPPLGAIYAAFDARTKPTVIEREALAMSAGLATLAIETSRLYADLVRRSEVDVLTDVQNRFAMERTLDAMIHNARQSAGIFAMIFIDLNEFKQVNDLHGHLVGDLYLQEVAQRMKRQLRPGDTLGRVGGDEFAVLVPEVRNRAEVEEIAARLESCFLEPFAGEGFVLRGSASIGVALYPEDATTAASLLRTADAAMYLAKYSKKGQKPGQSDKELAPKNRR